MKGAAVSVSIFRQRFPLAGVLLAAIAGIFLASWLGASRSLLFGVVGIFLLLAPIYRKGGLVLALAVAVFALLQLWCWSESPAKQFAAWLDVHSGEYCVEGVVAGEPKVSASGMATFPLRLEKLGEPAEGDGIDWRILPAGRLDVRVAWPVLRDSPSPVYGDRVRFMAVPERPLSPRNPGEFDYRAWLERHGIWTQFRIDPSEPGKIVAHRMGNPVLAWALAARHRLEVILSTDLQGARSEADVIKGVTLGVTENDPEGFTDDFRFTGTMHLFAVSGLHVGMLAVMIWFALTAVRIPRPWAVALIIPLLFFYVAVTGLKAGSIRSASMVALLLCGSVLYRRSPSLNTLSAAALFQLAVDPNVLFSAGWQFSYSVVFAILALAPVLQQKIGRLCAPDPFLPPKLFTPCERWSFEGWRHLAGLLGVSMAAWLGSLLPTAAYFHLISFSSLGANLLAIPLAFAVLALGGVSLLAGSFSLWMAGAFNNANWLAAKLLLVVVQSSALIPGGHWFVGPPAKPYPVLTLLDLQGGGECAVVQEKGRCALVNTGRKRDARQTILPFLESCGVNHIESILVSRTDAARLGGLPEITREVPVNQLGVLSVSTRSPVSKRVLESFSPSPVTLTTGESWPLLPSVFVEGIAWPDRPQENPEKSPPGMRLRCGKIRVIILPALEAGRAQRLLACNNGESLRAEVLVMPLGGSELFATREVIRRVHPEVVVCPVDHYAREGVPGREWESLLAEERVRLFRQDKTGAVTIEVAPNGMKILPFVPGADHALSDRNDAR